jgi:hypothetical protein
MLRRPEPTASYGSASDAPPVAPFWGFFHRDVQRPPRAPIQDVGYGSHRWARSRGPR